MYMKEKQNIKFGHYYIYFNYTELYNQDFSCLVCHLGLNFSLSLLQCILGLPSMSRIHVILPQNLVKTRYLEDSIIKIHFRTAYTLILLRFLIYVKKITSQRSLIPEVLSLYCTTKETASSADSCMLSVLAHIFIPCDMS